MISTIMNFHFTRESPEAKYCRDYRKLHFDYFSSRLSRLLDSSFRFIKEKEDCEELYEFNRFHRVFLNLLNIQVPLKKEDLKVAKSLYDKNIKKSHHDKIWTKSCFNKTKSDKT